MPTRNLREAINWRLARIRKRKPRQPQQSCAHTHPRAAVQPDSCVGDPTRSTNASNSKASAHHREIAHSKDCCFNCLRRGHRLASCPSKFSCALCKKKHHTLLHPEARSAVSSEPSALSCRPVNASSSFTRIPPAVSETSASAHVTQNSPMNDQFTLSATAMVNARTATGRQLRIRALLDQGSQSTLIEESIVQALRPKRFPASARAIGVGEVAIGAARHCVNVHVGSCGGTSDFVAASALVLPTLTRYVPCPCVQRHSWKHSSGLTLADFGTLL